MSHPMYRVVFFEIQAPYTLRVCFDDGTEQAIDFQALLEGELGERGTLLNYWNNFALPAGGG